MTDIPVLTGYSKENLDEVVEAIKKALSDPETRALSQRAVQGRVWHQQTAVSSMLSDLRAEEEVVRRKIMESVSKLVYKFHEHAMDPTFARAGLLHDPRVHPGSSLDEKEEFDVFCLDAKERLYIMMKNYGWMQDFFRLYPLHFYENSFAFVDRIPDKKLNKIRVKVVGLGIGGSVCVSGLAKYGIEAVGYEKRQEKGPRSVTSRYQNASWRAYDIAGKLVDDQAFQHLIENRQRINVKYDDGTEAVVTSDRVQIIIGSAIQSALDSARRYGADLHFECVTEDYFTENGPKDDCDIVALFCGAHTSEVFPGLKEEMGIMEWNDLNSTCKMWLQLKESDKTEAYCTRGGEIGAENWHYTIESARNDIVDIERIRDNLTTQYDSGLNKIEKGVDIGISKAELTANFEAQMSRCEKVLDSIRAGKAPGGRFDYIFTNAPLNEHNMAKREHVRDHVVLDGGYTVEIKIASKSTVTSGDLLKRFGTKLVVCGGDACVPPNPLAAYGATLACEAAGNLVQMAVGIGHLNSILADMDAMKAHVDGEWKQQVEDLKSMLTLYYEARARSENYFQWVQTLICNLYSLPPLSPAE